MNAVGVVLDSFGQPVREALGSAARLKFGAVEIAAVTGPISPEELSRSGQRDLVNTVRGMGMQLGALAADMGGGRFADSSAVEQRLERTRGILEMAAGMHVPVVTTHLGRFDAAVVQGSHLLEAVREIADMADRTGTMVALEAAAEPALLAELIKQVGCPLVGACYDPATLLIEGFEAAAGFEPLADRIFTAHVRDAVAGLVDRPGRETPLGQGEVDLAEVLAGLEQAGYRAAPYIRRSGAERPLDDLADAKRRLDAMMR